jgi:S1-C subfamily serine protease
MNKLFATLLLCVGLVLPLRADNWKGASERVTKSVVYIENEEGSCSGFVIDTERKLVMTAAHCDSEKGTIWIDRTVADIVSKDTKKDLAVFHVKDLDPSHPALALADKNPSVGDEVASVGFGFGLERAQFRVAVVSDNAMLVEELSGPFVAVNISFTPGQSGGPVVNEAGKVVAIVQRGDNGTLGFGVGADTIRERMGRFFHQ